jgi:alkylhydroperoxidase/carboxymuconolactone decarboxylase family protein YurZ
MGHDGAHGIWSGSRVMMAAELEQLLRKVALNDEPTLNQVLSGRIPRLIDHKTTALVRIAALAALEAVAPSYRAAIDNAHAAGAEDEEILETVLAIIPLIGTARLAAALPNVISALEHDI